MVARFKKSHIQLKSINYLEAIIARRHALERGADDVLFFNMEQYATETTVANLFIVAKGDILTPAVSQGILPGITRHRILHLASTK